ncbi:hypothetical protein ACWDFL_18580 [Streptomyces bungoensis]
MRASAQTRQAGLTVATALLALATASCGTGGDGGTDARQPTSSASATATEHGTEAAYDAGWRAGKRIFADGGKGSSVREVVWGGCVRRSLTAQPRAVVEEDRGAWVLGCKQGAGTGEDRHRPAHRVTRREPAPDLMPRFRSWAATHGDRQSAGHADRTVLVHLGARDYDVELTTTYTGRTPKPEVKRLADTFATWWDGDDGEDSTAWNLILLDEAGNRLTTRDL